MYILVCYEIGRKLLFKYNLNVNYMDGDIAHLPVIKTNILILRSLEI